MMRNPLLSILDSRFRGNDNPSIYQYQSSSLIALLPDKSRSLPMKGRGRLFICAVSAPDVKISPE
jgi:hypothetical protein